MNTFAKRLRETCRNNRSQLCVGLDPDPARMPVPDVLEFNRAIVDATSGLVCAYKPNLAFYEALGTVGLRALEGTIRHIRDQAPGAMIIGDAKRGDIGTAAAAYAKAMFGAWEFDAVTVNAWGGRDSLKPFGEYPGRGTFVWCRGSGPGAGEIQDLRVSTPAGSMPLHRRLAVRVSGWNERGNLGLVMGATFPERIREVRQLCRGLPLLIPGVGVQGGDLEAAVRNGTDPKGAPAVISCSRSILYASREPDFPQAARREAERLRERINRVLETGGEDIGQGRSRGRPC